MILRLLRFAPWFAFTALLGLIVVDVAPAQERPTTFPKLRAALHELREARREIGDARDTWPPGYRERALEATDDAIESVKKILAAGHAENFRGIDRGEDYYKRFKDHRRVRAAIQDLRDAREELLRATADAGDLKERALDDIDLALGHLIGLIRFTRQ